MSYPKGPRSTPVRYEASIVNGWLYFEDVRQAAIDGDLFAEILEDSHTPAIRVVSLGNDWESREHIAGVGKMNFKINLEMTLRCELRSGRLHWYAYRRKGGILAKRYVGQSDRVTSERLVKVANSML